MTSKKEALKAVADYTERSVQNAECIPDSQVDGVWAVQVPYLGNEGLLPLQFLVTGPTDNDVEEVEFTSWPPTS